MAATRLGTVGPAEMTDWKSKCSGKETAGGAFYYFNWQQVANMIGRERAS